MTENIEVITHSSICIRSIPQTVYIDPFDIKEDRHDADFVMITHDHYDHFSPVDIARVCTKETVLIVPEKMSAKARGISGMVKRIETVEPGKEYVIDSLRFSTVSAYNIMKPFHPKSARWVGYIIQAGEKRIYIAGDTDATKEAGEVRCDVALVPVGGTYTMDARKAAELINKIRPETAIPVHYGSIAGSRSDGEEFAKHVEAPVRVELKIKF